MHAITKLVVLGAVVGVGAMVVVQAQREFKNQREAAGENPPEPGAEAGDDQLDGERSDSDGRSREPDFSLDRFDEEGSETAAPVSTKSRPGSRAGLRQPTTADDDLLEDETRSSRNASRTVGAADDSDLFADDPPPKTRTDADDPPDRSPALRLNRLDDDDSVDKGAQSTSADSDQESGPRLLIGKNRSTNESSAADESAADPLGDEDAPVGRIRVAESEEPADERDDSRREPATSAATRSEKPAAEEDDAFPRIDRPSADQTAPEQSKASGPRTTLTDEDEPADRPQQTAPPTSGDPFSGDDDERISRDTVGSPRSAAETDKSDEKLPSRRTPAAPTMADDDDSPALKSKPAAPSLKRETDDPADFDSSPDRSQLRLPSKGSDRSVPTEAPRDDREDGAEIRRPAAAPPVDRPAMRRGPRPKLTIEKVAPATAVLGRPMVYQIVVKNVGPVVAQQVVVEDVLAEGVTIDGSIPQALLDDKRLIWKLGTLEPGAEKQIAVRVIPNAEGTLGSVATVNFATDAGSAETPAVPRLEFELSAPRQAVVGTAVPFKFRVSNVSRVDATGVMIRNVLPAGLRHPDGDDLEYEIGALPAGKSREIELMLTAAQAGKTLNRALVTADGNLTEEASASLDVVGPALHVKRAGPRKMYPGKNGQYTNTVTNPGDSGVTNVRVVETVPAGMEFAAASDGGQYDHNKRTVTWNLDRLAPQESKSLRITLNSASRGAQVGVVRAFDESGASGETVGTTHVSGVPALTIELGEIPALIDVGEIVKVPVRIRNRGSDSATNVRTSIFLPAGMELVSVQAPVEYRVVAAGSPEIARRQRTGAATHPVSRGADELQFSPLSRLDPRGDATIELTLKASKSGNARVQVQAGCDQIPDPIRREEVATITAAPE